MIYITSDWHLNHEKALEYDERPFRTIEDMNYGIGFNAKKQLKDGDTLIVAGDVGYGRDTISEVLAMIPGRKICVTGNHDKKHGMLLECGFDLVVYNMTVKIAGQFVTISHCPLQGLYREDIKSGKKGTHWHKDYKHTQYSMENKGQFHLHGHIHSRPGRTDNKTIEGRQIDIGVCAWNYRPVPFSHIEKIIKRELN